MQAFRPCSEKFDEKEETENQKTFLSFINKSQLVRKPPQILQMQKCKMCNNNFKTT